MHDITARDNASQAMNGGDLIVRVARIDDLHALVAMLADDTLGREREDLRDPLPESYGAAFRAIDTDPNNEILVACIGDRVVATLQITYTPSLSHRGSWRATLESVRTASDLRRRGIGKRLVRDAIERARARGCSIVQLSTNKVRADAQRFYEGLGFRATHQGMKMDVG